MSNRYTYVKYGRLVGPAAVRLEVVDDPHWSAPPVSTKRARSAWWLAGCQWCARREAELRRAKRRVAELEAELEQVRRAGKRQAAPFSKGQPKDHPRRPGRRAGAAYGTKAYRPLPEQVDREVDVALPQACPDCGGALQELRVAEQYQEELPAVRPEVTRFRVHIGRCQACGRRVQPRHPEQTSSALGAAGVQLGPRAVALVALLTKVTGASLGKAAALLGHLGGLHVTPGGLSQAQARLARRASPTYHALVEDVRHSPVVSAHETGWKVGGRLHWLWVFATPHATVYRIQPGRGFTQAASVLGEDFSGVLERDGWAPYRRFTHAQHQTCTAHLLRRCHELLVTATGRARQFPLAVQRLLHQGLALRTARDHGLSETELAAAVHALDQHIDHLLAMQLRRLGNVRLRNHLRRERAALFTYLAQPAVQATTWRAEQAIRPIVVTRKVWGGNRTPTGAHTQQVLASIFRTCHQQGTDALAYLADLLRIRSPVQTQLAA